MGISNGVITDSKLGTAKVTKDILPTGRCIPGGSIKPIKITVHDTGNTGHARNQHNYLKNNNKASGSNAKASWHFSVDDTDIYQAVATNKKAWHAGNSTGNNTSIGIEISQRTSADAQKKAYLNAIALIKMLQKAYGISDANVVRHKDWTGKDCPYNLNHNKYGMNWTWFKNQLKEVEKPMVKTAIIVGNEVDKIAAEIIKWKLKDAKILTVEEANKYNIGKKIAIGATGSKIKADVVIQGKDRYETTQKALDYVKSL